MLQYSEIEHHEVKRVPLKSFAQMRCET
jgi:hypothetical protein